LKKKWLIANPFFVLVLSLSPVDSLAEAMGRCSLHHLCGWGALSNKRAKTSYDVEEPCLLLEGSEAVRLLRLDMDEGKHHTMRPRDLYQTRPQYYENYPLTVFRGHIDQEERRRKYIVFLKKKQAGR
jgi:hypothetical protein